MNRAATVALDLIERRSQIATFPALLQAGETRIDGFYELHAPGSDRVAGRDAIGLGIVMAKGGNVITAGSQALLDEALAIMAH